ncbi:MAG: hypothetical protein ABFD04_01850 [Syntrophomonas sp.]
MVQAHLRVPEWLLNGPAVAVLNCSKDTGDWVYHGIFHEELEPVSCQHETTTEPVAMFEVKRDDKLQAGLGKCHICQKVHWLLQEDSHDSRPH